MTIHWFPLLAIPGPLNVATAEGGLGWDRHLALAERHFPAGTWGCCPPPMLSSWSLNWNIYLFLQQTAQWAVLCLPHSCTQSAWETPSTESLVSLFHSRQTPERTWRTQSLVWLSWLTPNEPCPPYCKDLLPSGSCGVQPGDDDSVITRFVSGEEDRIATHVLLSTVGLLWSKMTPFSNTSTHHGTNFTAS